MNFFYSRDSYSKSLIQDILASNSSSSEQESKSLSIKIRFLSVQSLTSLNPEIVTLLVVNIFNASQTVTLSSMFTVAPPLVWRVTDEYIVLIGSGLVTGQSEEAPTTIPADRRLFTVSYTHLTLPTILLV